MMTPEQERLASLTANINTHDDLIDTLVLLQEKFDVRICAVTRGYVNDEFSQAHEFDGDGPRDLTDAEWEKFTDEWFWTKGYAEVMFSDVPNAIRWDLREASLVPQTTVVE